MLWPKREEFVRMAARFGATIVPVSGIGCNDCVQLIADADDLKQIPILGKRLEESSRKQMPPARRYVSCHHLFLVKPFGPLQESSLS